MSADSLLDAAIASLHRGDPPSTVADSWLAWVNSNLSYIESEVRTELPPFPSTWLREFFAWVRSLPREEAWFGLPRNSEGRRSDLPRGAPADARDLDTVLAMIRILYAGQSIGELLHAADTCSTPARWLVLRQLSFPLHQKLVHLEAVAIHALRWFQQSSADAAWLIPSISDWMGYTYIDDDPNAEAFRAASESLIAAAAPYVSQSPSLVQRKRAHESLEAVREELDLTGAP